VLVWTANYKLQAVVSFVERASGHLEVIYAFINEARIMRISLCEWMAR